MQFIKGGDRLLNQIIRGDCLEVMKDIPDKSIDMILCDLPYGTTACKWDTIIPFEPLWEQYERVIKDNGAIVLTASQQFTFMMAHSCFHLFRYNMIWKKSKVTLFQHCNKRPLRNYEDVLVFYKKQPTYNPQGLKELNKKVKRKSAGKTFGDNWKSENEYTRRFTNYPTDVIDIPNEGNTIHPTQKPVALFEYLIRTYTNEGEVVLDNCIGSGTTAIACLNTGRSFIGIEKDEHYHQVATKRVQEWHDKRGLF